MAPILIAHCRSGFEQEAGVDLERIAAQAKTTVTIDASARQGFVVAEPARFDRVMWAKALRDAAPIFIRSMFVGSGPHKLFDHAGERRPDRIPALVALIEPLQAEPWFDATTDARVFSEIRLEMADTNDGKKLSGLCRALSAPLDDALHQRGLLADAAAAPIILRGMKRIDDTGSARLHVFFIDGARVYVGVSVVPWSSPWPMGIPRIRMPRGAPSRSTLKFAEAVMTFLGDRESALLRAGMRAVDLGAAPGGWTWQLAHRGIHVIAIDNGPLKGEVASNPLVQHLRVDGFTYRPRRPVDWMVCDMVEQPARMAALVARWIAEGLARRSLFNLKLPMKRRYDEAVRCSRIIEDEMRQARAGYRIALRQLYHDREEITGFIERL